MDAQAFLRDIEQRPEVLRAAARAWASDDPWQGLSLHGGRLVFLGMGSSHYANAVAAARLQHRGIPAVATIASSQLLPAVDEDDVVIAVSASGSSVETIDAVERLRGRCRVVLVTNTDGGSLRDLADEVVYLRAGPETGGVACRSFTHTQALLLLLEAHLAGGIEGGVLERAADAMADLLDTRDGWLAPVSELLLGPQGTSFVAPAERFSSAQQSALMLREGPRLPAIACETGDWSHVDVYLTKTTDYRMLLLAGSRWEAQLMDWCTQRGSTVVAAGGEVAGAALSVRYRHDEEELVRLLAEVTIAELVAATRWLRAGGGGVAAQIPDETPTGHR